jgi:hypothetical protein
MKLNLKIAHPSHDTEGYDHAANMDYAGWSA